MLHNEPVDLRDKVVDSHFFEPIVHRFVGRGHEELRGPIGKAMSPFSSSSGRLIIGLSEVRNSNFGFRVLQQPKTCR